jgi:phosphoribosylanthranilate isomerase
MRVKICGITDLDDALMCERYGADALGFIFYAKSPRNVTPKNAQKIVASLGCLVQTVGVFVDEKKEAVDEIAAAVGLDVLQFHGCETPVYCDYFSKKYKVMKTFFPKNDKVLDEMQKYKVDAYLLDIPFEDKKAAPQAQLDTAFVKAIVAQNKKCIFSGGITPQNVKEILSSVTPYAIDVARGVESMPGKKDESLVRELMKAVRK